MYIDIDRKVDTANSVPNRLSKILEIDLQVLIISYFSKSFTVWNPDAQRFCVDYVNWRATVIAFSFEQRYLNARKSTELAFITLPPSMMATSKLWYQIHGVWVKWRYVPSVYATSRDDIQNDLLVQYTLVISFWFPASKAFHISCWSLIKLWNGVCTIISRPLLRLLNVSRMASKPLKLVLGDRNSFPAARDSVSDSTGTVTCTWRSADVTMYCVPLFYFYFYFGTNEASSLLESHHKINDNDLFLKTTTQESRPWNRGVNPPISSPIFVIARHSCVFSRDVICLVYLIFLDQANKAKAI
jgi:hypothetical protein